ncbi:hypothetical protein WN943_019043 [Citrus x changshan-huyou]
MLRTWSTQVHVFDILREKIESAAMQVMCKLKDYNWGQLDAEAVEDYKFFNLSYVLVLRQL